MTALPIELKRISLYTEYTTERKGEIFNHGGLAKSGLLSFLDLSLSKKEPALWLISNCFSSD